MAKIVDVQQLTASILPRLGQLFGQLFALDCCCAGDENVS